MAPVIWCEFSARGLDLKKKRFEACQMVYPPKGISVGPNFTTRCQHGLGLACPNVCNWPTFICEACIVHAVLGHKLTGPGGWKLLCFELMCLLDMARYWADRTHQICQDYLKLIRNFEGTFVLRSCIPCLCFALPLVLKSLCSGARSHIVCSKAHYGTRMALLTSPLLFLVC
jgi:hypothetical protein